MFASLAIACWSAVAANAQVKEVVVGITTNCPYENAIEGSCWSGAYRALTALDGIRAVDKLANGYNCTARIYLNDNVVLDPDKWAAQFKKRVGNSHIFRGIEVTACGAIEAADGGLVARIPGISKPIKLDQLKHKLQWNFRKHSARQPEPDESDAYRQLQKMKEEAHSAQLHGVELTGPFTMNDKGYILEVREFFVSSSKSSGPSAK
jgi:hypothetical protein